jgi:hypothetical protein
MELVAGLLALAGLFAAWVAYGCFERRGRLDWQGLQLALGTLGGAPYRMAHVRVGLARAPFRVRAGTLFCLLAGSLWPALFVVSLDALLAMRTESFVLNIAWQGLLLAYWTAGPDLVRLAKHAPRSVTRVAVASLVFNGSICGALALGAPARALDPWQIVFAVALAVHAGVVLAMRPERWPTEAERGAPRRMRWVVMPCAGLYLVLGISTSLVELVTGSPWSRERANVTWASVRELQRAAEKWRETHARYPCPTPERLAADRAIDSASKLTDAWSRPYRIECIDDVTIALSAGPDGMFGTADDIPAPQGVE